MMTYLDGKNYICLQQSKGICNPKIVKCLYQMAEEGKIMESHIIPLLLDTNMSVGDFEDGCNLFRKQKERESYAAPVVEKGVLVCHICH